jgi:hypothetical protein
MKQRLSLILAGIVFSLSAMVAQPKVSDYAKTLQAKNLKKHVYVLASDSCEGRNPGSNGILIARNYIVEQWKQTPGLEPGLADGYLQDFELLHSGKKNIRIQANGYTLTEFKDYMYSGKTSYFKSEIPILFAGYGSEEELANLDIKGKAVFILNNNLRAFMPNAVSAQKQGAALSLVANPKIIRQFESISEQQKAFLSFKGYRSPKDTFLLNWKHLNDYRNLTLSSLAVKKITGHGINYWKRKSGKPGETIGNLTLEVKQNKTDTLITSNILAMIPGTNSNEYLVVGAHYDHLGIIDKEIYYGADDNSSGTAAVIELAKTFSRAYSDGYRPQKNILFIAFTAEESGLIGSEYFVKNFNQLANIKLMINIDMIGRSDTEHADDPAYFYFIGHHLEDSIYQQGSRFCKKYRLTPDFTSTIDVSDNKPFFTAGIPTLFFFDGINSDLHQPGDTPDKINYERMEKISRVIFETVWSNALMTNEYLNN